ncbi:unnamed protein product [Adineta steineri]|uniref:Ketoreductase domain-containing protein n=2 Tax=Adineta steineri TaxID=433720 RepID=A0A815J8R6_9BILA|nr:unnamed protein product [Adineta steineri]CAF1606906.1 unnamed protein product [Adineta steineri]
MEIVHVCIQALSHYIFSTTEKNIRNEVVLITGSGRGLGQQMAILFAKRGAIVVLCDSPDIGNSETLELISSINNEKRVHAYTCDIGNRVEVKLLVERIQTEVGNITMLVNNATVLTSNSILDMSEDEFSRSLNANLFSAYWLIRQILPSMMRRNHGHIITMLGSTAVFGLGNFSAVCTAKSGLVGLMESIDHELTLGGYDGIYTTAAVSHYLTTHLFQLSKTCFNPVIPPLTLDYAAKKIMHAILINRKFVCVPRLYYLIPFVKGILPARAFLIILNTLVNPKIPIYTQHELSSKHNLTSSTQHIPRKRSHMSACQ